MLCRSSRWLIAIAWSLLHTAFADELRSNFSGNITSIRPDRVDGPRHKGVNLAGAEFGEIDGKFGSAYSYPGSDSIHYFKGQGANTFRLPFRWERIQPALGSQLDNNELQRIRQFVASASAENASVILDVHNYGRYREFAIGSAQVTDASFADLWTRLANEFKSQKNVMFGLMNEPLNIDAARWVLSANAAIDAIRATGADNYILVPGVGYTGAHSWFANWYGTPNSVAMLQIHDSRDKTVFEVHQYLDNGSSGVSPLCTGSPDGVTRLDAFTGWLIENKRLGFLAEFAAGSDSVCLAELVKLLSHMEANSSVWFGWTWWAAGPRWGSYQFSIEPGNEARTRPQMDVLVQFMTRKPPARSRY